MNGTMFLIALVFGITAAARSEIKEVLRRKKLTPAQRDAEDRKLEWLGS